MREDWKVVKLGEFAAHEKGKKPKNQKAEKDDVFKYPYVNIEAFEKGIVETYTDGEKCNFCYEDDFLIVWDGSRSGLVGKGMNGALGSTLVRINFPGIENNYAYHYLSSKYQEINTRAKGTGTPHVDPYLLWNYDFPISPLPEQRAIVAKIEELFSDLDKGIADLKKAQDQLVVFRQAVLSSSFPKKELMELSKLVPSLSQGWSPKCINQNSSDETQWAVIKTSAIQAGKFVDFENKILPESLEPREQHEIKTGDILITRAGPRVRVGICCLVRNTRPRLINCDKVYRIILDRNKVDGEYFEYVMNSPEILSEIEVMKSGTNDSGLNLTQKAFLKLRIPYVPLDQQRQIVRKIESRLSVCDKVEQSIAESLDKAKALRQSILKKAFEGTLLSKEEIAACKAAKDYEPASVLLKKIKAEKKK
ncbi:restriction endonuclease subunit S [Flavobacteriaceae bacterium]|nr:restriction endonuclease subunit S [Flavobacteriaceae bacterium]